MFAVKSLLDQALFRTCSEVVSNASIVDSTSAAVFLCASSNVDISFSIVDNSLLDFSTCLVKKLKFFVVIMTKIIAARSHHKHLRGIDRSSAIVAPWAMALNPGPDQYTGPAFSAKACFMVAGDITNTVNKGNWAGPMSSLLIWMSMANTKCKTYNLLSNESKII